MGVASLKEHVACHVTGVGIVKNGFQIALNACHRRLELVCNVLRQLAFKHVLLASCGLQSLVNLDYALGNFAQFVGRKANKVLCVERFAVVGTCGKCAQPLNVVVQSACKAVQYDGKQQYGAECKPDVVLVGL